MTTTEQRRDAIDSGVRNAVDTVCIDKAMTRDEALASLQSFVEDGLSCRGLPDIATDDDMEYARSVWPL